MKIAILSFFAGIGFLDLGFEKSGYDIVYVNEYHTPFLDGYAYARKKLKLQQPEMGYFNGDVNELLTRQHKQIKKVIKDVRKDYDFVGFIGGPPCPDFSIGGKNKGEKGENGQLSRSYADLIINLKPDFFLFENVKGLWSTQKHRKFYDVLKSSIANNGYDVTDKLINCIEYGVPQDRWRVFLVGFRQGLIPQKNAALDFAWNKYTNFSPTVLTDYPWPTTDPFAEDSILEIPKNIPKKITTEAWFLMNKTEHHPNTIHCFKPKAALSKFQSILEGDDSRKSFKRIHRWRYSPTACYGNNEVHLHPYKARRLNVAEVLSIQSLPREFELPGDMTLTNMFKAIGNGVPYLAAKGIAKTIKDYLDDDNINGL